MHWGRCWKAKFTQTATNCFDVGGKARSDTAVNLLLVQFNSWSLRGRRKNPRLQADSWDCSLQRGPTALRGLRECGRMQIRLRAAKTVCHQGIEFKKNKIKKWQHDAKVLAAEGLQCSISLVLHSTAESAFQGYGNISMDYRETFSRHLEILHWKCKKGTFVLFCFVLWAKLQQATDIF